jgi:hypothetical protein
MNRIFSTIAVALLGSTSYVVTGSAAQAADSVVRLADGGSLQIHDTMLVHMGSDRRARWSYSEEQIFFDAAYIPVTGLVYATAGDNTLVILRLATGELIHRDSRNGRAAYGTVTPYGADRCLVTDNFRGYRENLNNSTIADGVTCWRGTKKIWHRSILADATIVVRGKRVYARVRTRGPLISIYPSKVPKFQKATPN